MHRRNRSPISKRSPHQHKKSKSPSHRNQAASHGADSSLQLALELAEHHRKETEATKERVQKLEQQQVQKERKTKELQDKVKELETINEKNNSKYRKMKEKYRNIKKLQKSQNLPVSEQPQHNKEPNFDQQNLQANSNLVREFQSQLDHKDRIIKHLSEEINTCERNTMDVLKLVDILEQRIQELTMQNHLLRGIVREKQSHYETGGDISYEVAASGLAFSQCE